MNRIFKYIESAGIATALVVALLCSCSDNEISRTQTEVSISYPADAEGLTIVSEEIKAVNLSTGQTQILPSKSKIDIVSGLYDFIIEEIFFTGTLRPSGSAYYGDGYIKIFNNTDHVLYAD
ncbi:MAG: hypothetical protein II065_04025, partial [Bacteroidaceae bacterium]|nr:hypothetical protein [Bacteroidaceae bacterium]